MSTFYWSHHTESIYGRNYDVKNVCHRWPWICSNTFCLCFVVFILCTQCCQFLGIVYCFITLSVFSKVYFRLSQSQFFTFSFTTYHQIYKVTQRVPLVEEVLFSGQLGLISVISWIHVAQPLIYGVVVFKFFILFLFLSLFLIFFCLFFFSSLTIQVFVY